MKNLKNLILLVGVLSFFMSCSNDAETDYSCDKLINVWVKENISTIRHLDRSDWKQFPPSKGLAIYRAFSKEQKIDFWLAKFEELESLSWNAREREHIRLAKDFVESHSDFFNDSELTEDQENELDIFFYKWMTHAEKELHWDRRIVFAIICSGYSLANTDGDLLVNISSQTSNMDALESLTTTETIPECNCKHKHVLACFGGPDECQEIDCYQSIGCGWLWLETCTGKCGM